MILQHSFLNMQYIPCYMLIQKKKKKAGFVLLLTEVRAWADMSRLAALSGHLPK